MQRESQRDGGWSREGKIRFLGSLGCRRTTPSTGRVVSKACCSLRESVSADGEAVLLVLGRRSRPKPRQCWWRWRTPSSVLRSNCGGSSLQETIPVQKRTLC
eukprot:COSAG01_NODE_68_length_28978_cov_182.027777_11_plen_102_part_00